MVAPTTLPFQTVIAAYEPQSRRTVVAFVLSTYDGTESAVEVLLVNETQQFEILNQVQDDGGGVRNDEENVLTLFNKNANRFSSVFEEQGKA